MHPVLTVRFRSHRRPSPTRGPLMRPPPHFRRKKLPRPFGLTSFLPKTRATTCDCGAAKEMGPKGGNGWASNAALGKELPRHGGHPSAGALGTAGPRPRELGPSPHESFQPELEPKVSRGVSLVRCDRTARRGVVSQAGASSYKNSSWGDDTKVRILSGSRSCGDARALSNSSWNTIFKVPRRGRR
jgi:hypothetical protein